MRECAGCVVCGAIERWVAGVGVGVGVLGRLIERLSHRRLLWPRRVGPLLLVEREIGSCKRAL